MATQNSEKPIHSIIIDTGPLINNTVSISTIINSAEVLYTTPAIIAEIRDPATRSRVETTLLPFLNVKTPSPASFEAVTEFSKKTGDFPVLSKQDLGILALAYEVHCEKNGGPFGLRSVPKGPVKLRPEEQAKVDEQTAKKEAEKAKREAAEAKKNAKEAAIQRRKEERKQRKKEEKAAAVSKGDITPNAQNGEPAVNASRGGIQLLEEPSTIDPTESKPAERTIEEITQSQQQPTEEYSAKPSTGSQGPPEDAAVPEEEAIIEALPQQDGESAAPVASPKQKDGQKKRKVNSKKARRARAYLGKQALANAEITEEQPVQDSFEGISPDGEENTRGVDNSDASPAAQVPEQARETEQAVNPQPTQGPEPTKNPEQAQEFKGDQDFEHVPQKKLHPAKARLARRAAERAALANENPASSPITQQPTPPATSEEESDGGEWITPGNLSKHKTNDTSNVPLRKGEPQLNVATMTTDYAMQNVLLQMNMQLLSPAMQRIRQVRSTILRCHACFLTTREMDKQFCPRCGQPTLQRVSCSTNSHGQFQLHLSTKYQYNKRGDIYSIPKPVGGTSNGKMRGPGGGKGGWGRELVLSEDQKEYQRQIGEQKRSKAKDPMDEDYLPGILTGERSQAGGRPKVGAGRNVNSRKRV